MGIDLTQKEISVVNVGSTAYLHFARIFMRRNEPNMNVKCAIVTDLDVKPDDPEKKQKEDTKRTNVNRSLGELPDNVKLFLAKEWTLEWCLFKSPVLSEIFKDSIAAVHCRTNEFKKREILHSISRSLRPSLKECWLKLIASLIRLLLL